MSSQGIALNWLEFQDTIEKRFHQDVALIPASEGDPCYFHFSEPVGTHSPHSALVDLIQGIYATYPDQARRILRSRIHYRGAFRPLESGMVKVAAKRVTRHESLPELFRELGSRSHGFVEVLNQSVTRRDFLAPADRDSEVHSLSSLVQRVQGRAFDLESARNGIPLHRADRPVFAVLADSRGRVLWEAENANHSNKTLHAELVLAQEWWAKNKRPFPEGAQVIVSLKPCKMCAGALWQMADHPGALRVVYVEEDPGSFARDTILDSGSLERLRFCEESLRRVEIQKRGIGI